jgi:hypothetical protein
MRVIHGIMNSIKIALLVIVLMVVSGCAKNREYVAVWQRKERNGSVSTGFSFYRASELSKKSISEIMSYALTNETVGAESVVLLNIIKLDD